MNATMACIAGEEIHRQWNAGRFTGQALGPRTTPFGQSSEIFLVEDDAPFYLMPRTGNALDKTPAARVNHRANLYALKDMGVLHILDWGPGGAVTHNMAVGDLVILDDVIDQTRLRQRTFFEDNCLGFLRQFPVFCPPLRKVLGNVLTELRMLHHDAGIAAVSEGPRLETPAEIRMLANMGAQVVTHSFVPEAFLAKELEMCYAPLCYLVNYAETGSRHRPFAAGELFGGLTQRSDNERLHQALGGMHQIVRQVAQALVDAPAACDCTKTMEHSRRMYHLDADWRKWVKPS